MRGALRSHLRLCRHQIIRRGYRIDDEPDAAQVPVQDSLVDASPDADASVASFWDRMRSGFLLGETRNYLPKLLAVRNLIARFESYGLTLEDVPNRPYFEVVITEHNIDVKLAAQFARISVEDFRALNLSHNRPVFRAERGQPILLPADRVERFHSNREAHNEPLVSWQSYQIGRRDTLKIISRRFGIAPAKLKTVNGLTARSRKLTGLTILVPTTDKKSAGDIAAAGFAIPLVPDKHVNTSTIKYVVKSGESLWRIARRFGVRVAQLAKQIGIRNGRLLAGQTLTIR